MDRSSPQLKFISVTLSSANMTFLAITVMPSGPAIVSLILLIVNICRILHYLVTTSRPNNESQETK